MRVKFSGLVGCVVLTLLLPCVVSAAAFHPVLQRAHKQLATVLLQPSKPMHALSLDSRTLLMHLQSYLNLGGQVLALLPAQRSAHFKPAHTVSLQLSSDKAAYHVQVRLGALQQNFDAPITDWRRLCNAVSDVVYRAVALAPGFYLQSIATVSREKTGAGFRYHLHVSRWDGSEAKEILTSDEAILRPAWSPDNTQLVVLGLVHGHPVLYRYAQGDVSAVAWLKATGWMSSPRFAGNDTVIFSEAGRSGFEVKQVTLGSSSSDSLYTPHAAAIQPAYDEASNRYYMTILTGEDSYIAAYSPATQNLSSLNLLGKWTYDPSMGSDGNTLVYGVRTGVQTALAAYQVATKKNHWLVRGSVVDSPVASRSVPYVIYLTPYAGKLVPAMVSLSGEIMLVLADRNNNYISVAW